MNSINTIIFDLGGVLIDWNPAYVFTENYFESPDQREYFFKHICTNDWNEEQDAGRSIVEATQDLVQKFPEWETAIRDYYGRWTDMLRGQINETVDILRQLKDSNNYRLFALTNWQADLFHIALVRYNFLHWFDGRLVSGEEKTRKPFPEFYQRLFHKFAVNPAEALFIDDNLRNVKAGEILGLKGIHFINPGQLKVELKNFNIDIK